MSFIYLNYVWQGLSLCPGPIPALYNSKRNKKRWKLAARKSRGSGGSLSITATTFRYQTSSKYFGLSSVDLNSPNTPVPPPYLLNKTMYMLLLILTVSTNVMAGVVLGRGPHMIFLIGYNYYNLYQASHCGVIKTSRSPTQYSIITSNPKHSRSYLNSSIKSLPDTYSLCSQDCYNCHSWSDT